MEGLWHAPGGLPLSYGAEEGGRVRHHTMWTPGPFRMPTAGASGKDQPLDGLVS